MAWINLTMANQTVKSGLKAKKIKLPQFFILQNFKKILRPDPELWGCVIFGLRMAHLSWTNFFWYKPFFFLFRTYLGLFIEQNFLKTLQRMQSYNDASFLGPKWPISPNEIFFQKTCWWDLFLSFPPTYMAKIKVRYKSISEILTIKEYWNLIDREPFLAITWELDFSQVCSFRNMLMNHNKFHFTQIPDKTNNVIFLKSPKTMLLDHFWSFLS